MNEPFGLEKQELDASVDLHMEARLGKDLATVEIRIKVNADNGVWTEWTPLMERMCFNIPQHYDVEVVMK